MVPSQAGSLKRRKSENAIEEDAVISHALIIRTQQLQELLVEADHARLIDDSCPSAPINVGALAQHLQRWLRRTLLDARSPRTVLRPAPQSESDVATPPSSSGTRKEDSLMRQIVYAMRFTGQATPVGPDGNVLRASTSSPSTAITSRVGADGLSGTVDAVPGDAATFTSEVTFTSETDFLETGTITFGNGHQLRFDTVGQGYLGPSADSARKHGTVMWRIDGWRGAVRGCEGLITSNFFVDAQLGVVDHHFGVLLLQ